MLTRTFCHIPGIGHETERALWEQGCIDWKNLLDRIDDVSIGTASKQIAQKTLEMSIEALESRNHQFFRKALTGYEAWRAWPEFRDSCVYLDIETDGGQSGKAVTTVGLYDGKDFKCLIRNQDLESFRDEISHYSMIVTFFGSGFDLPMLERRFPGIVFDQIHIDLCPTLKRLGYRGGLKKIEKQVGISRGDDIDGLGGQDAIRLWRLHEWGSDTALDQLIAYNREDVVNLEVLAQLAYDKLSALTLAGVKTTLHERAPAARPQP